MLTRQNRKGNIVPSFPEFFPPTTKKKHFLALTRRNELCRELFESILFRESDHRPRIDGQVNLP